MQRSPRHGPTCTGVCGRCRGRGGAVAGPEHQHQHHWQRLGQEALLQWACRPRNHTRVAAAAQRLRMHAHDGCTAIMRTGHTNGSCMHCTGHPCALRAAHRCCCACASACAWCIHPADPAHAYMYAHVLGALPLRARGPPATHSQAGTRACDAICICICMQRVLRC